MQLPGGIIKNGVRITDYGLKPMCGEFELACCELASRFDLLPPVEVTGLLSMTLAHIGGQAISWQEIHNMTVGDRQFLLRTLMIALEHDNCWMSSECDACNNRFDLNLTLSTLPVTQCSETFPYVEVIIDACSYRFRAPTGADQDKLLQRGNVSEQDILPLLLTEPDFHHQPGATFPRCLSEYKNLIEEKIETMAPAITSKIQTACPECSKLMVIDISPERLILQIGKNIYPEVHQIASAYHWSEAEILKMPTLRRKNYLSLIDRAKGHNQLHHSVA